MFEDLLKNISLYLKCHLKLITIPDIKGIRKPLFQMLKKKKKSSLKTKNSLKLYQFIIKINMDFVVGFLEGFFFSCACSMWKFPPRDGTHGTVVTRAAEVTMPDP